jgi:hypothetical protein
VLYIGDNTMSIENHIKKLITEHRTLDDEITSMESSGSFDDHELVEKKKQRLLLKDEIIKLQKANVKVLKRSGN